MRRLWSVLVCIHIFLYLFSIVMVCLWTWLPDDRLAYLHPWAIVYFISSTVLLMSRFGKKP